LGWPSRRRASWWDSAGSPRGRLVTIGDRVAEGHHRHLLLRCRHHCGLDEIPTANFLVVCRAALVGRVVT
jgi:hypothetical protein